MPHFNAPVALAAAACALAAGTAHAQIKPVKLRVADTFPVAHTIAQRQPANQPCTARG